MLNSEKYTLKNSNHDISKDQLVVPAASLALKVDLRVHNPHVPRQSIVPAKCLLFTTELTPDLLLLTIVDSILVPREVVWPAEDGIARLAGTWIDARALVGSSLRVASCKSTASQTCAEID